MAVFALGLGEKRYGSIAAFSVALFGDDKRQQVLNWRYRGLPSNQHMNIAHKLDLTVEQLLAGGKIPVSEPEISLEAKEFAREWSALPALVRSQIQALVRSLPKESGRVVADKPVHERPMLQRRRSA